MKSEMRVILCEDLAVIEREFPEGISVVREMLAEVEEQCQEKASI